MCRLGGAGGGVWKGAGAGQWHGSQVEAKFLQDGAFPGDKLVYKPC